MLNMTNTIDNNERRSKTIRPAAVANMNTGIASFVANVALYNLLEKKKRETKTIKV